MKKSIFLLAILAVCLLAVFACQESSAPQTNSAPSPKQTAIPAPIATVSEPPEPEAKPESTPVSSQQGVKELKAAFVNVILQTQSRYVFDSYGEWAGQCFTNQMWSAFCRENVAGKVTADLKADAYFRDLMAKIDGFPTVEWHTIRTAGLKTYEPTWAQNGGISRDGQSDAGQRAEKAIAQAVVAAADALLK